MRNAIKQAPALKPISSIASRITDTLVHMPLHGGGTATINVSAVSLGNPTRITLGAAFTGIVGQTVKLASLGGVTQLNGYAKVIGLAPANGVVVDVDSSAFAAYTSGGTMAFNVIADSMGNLAPQDIQGTVTGIWANPANGITAHTGGTNTNRITTGLDAFDLSAFSGYLVLAFDLVIAATPSAKEIVFALGCSSTPGTNSGAGCIQAAIETSGIVTCTFRPKTAADGGGTNSFISSPAIGNATKRSIALVVDMTGGGVMHIFMDGVVRTSVSLTLTNSIGNPSIAAGVAIGALIHTDLNLFYKLGSAAVTPSQAKIANLLWWKSTKGFATTMEAVKRYASTSELNELMV